MYDDDEADPETMPMIADGGRKEDRYTYSQTAWATIVNRETSRSEGEPALRACWGNPRARAGSEEEKQEGEEDGGGGKRSRTRR